MANGLEGGPHAAREGDIMSRVAVIDTYELADRYRIDEGRAFISGSQALARLPYEQLRADRRAGLNTAAYITGYPGSPLAGYDRALALKKDFVQAHLNRAIVLGDLGRAAEFYLALGLTQIVSRPTASICPKM